MQQDIKAGFAFLVEVLKNGEVVESEVVHNIMPTQGLNYVQSILFKGASVVPTWYIGLYEGNYVPLAGDTAATFPASATECTAYDEATRQAFVPGTVSAGAVDDSTTYTFFTMPTGLVGTKTIYGGFVASASAKGATSGTLLSAVRFSTPKVLDADAVLRVTTGFTVASV